MPPPVVDPRANLISSLRVDQLEVSIQNNPLIFLCGGKVEDDEAEPALSVRDKLLRHLVATSNSLIHNISRAEEFKDWAEDSVYKNLHDFENHIGSMSSLITIILESAGSLVELGMFAENAILKSKLLVIIDTDHFDQDSFIKHGPIKSIELKDSNRVSVRQMGLKNPRKYDNNELQEITTDIEEEIKRLRTKVPFKKDDDGHIAFLIVALVYLFKALKADEIEAYLETLLQSEQLLSLIHI